MIVLLLAVLLMPAEAWGQRTIPPGQSVAEQVAVPNAARRQVATARMGVANHRNPSACVSMMLQITVDGGTTWRDVAGLVRCGSTPGVDRQGRPAVEAAVQGTLPTKTNRQVRVLMTATEAIQTAAVVLETGPAR